MKPTSFNSRWFSLLACALTVSFANAAVDSAASPPPAHQSTYAERIALGYLQMKIAATDVDAKLTRLGIGPGKRHDEIVTLTKAMRALADDGIVPDSTAFWELLAGTPPPIGLANPPANPPAADPVQTAARGLWRRGMMALNALPPSNRERLLAFNHIPESSGKIPAFDAALQSGPPATFQKAGPAATVTDTLGAFLIRTGYEARLSDTTKGTAPMTPEDKQAADDLGFNGTITPPAFNADAKLRNAGISFATGVGIILHRGGSGGDASTGALLARWNLIQRYATARWNHRVGDRNLDGYGLVSSYGNIEFRSGGLFSNTHEYRTTYSRLAKDTSVLPNLTFCGPFLGTAAVGEKIREPGTVAADNKDERPYLVGWSLGWGFFDEASSLAYLDVGTTISPHKGMDGTRVYVGASFDAIVFAKIFSGIGRQGGAAAAEVK